MELRRIPADARALAVRWSRRIPQSIRRAVTTFGERRGAEAAASMAYYAFLSFFPLLIFMVAAASLLVQQERVYDQLRLLLREIFPLANDLLAANLDEILRLRAPVGIVAFFTLLWSGIGFFSALSHHVNMAWPEARMRTFLGQRVMGLKMAGALLVLFIVSLVLSVGARLLENVPLLLPGLRELVFSPNWTLLARLVPWFASLVLFLALYRFAPNTVVTWRAAFLGAILASIAWQAVTLGFSWYLGSGFANYQVVYGSLGGIVALLFWVYLTNLIAIFGAHIAAAVDATRPAKAAPGPLAAGSGQS